MMRRRNDSGATALIVAIMSLLLFSMGAMAVDLGNAFARKRDTQASADFAALAGGAKLPSASGLASACPATPPASTDPVVAQVVSYLNANKTSTDAGSNTVNATQLVDCDLKNGEVTFPSKFKVTVYTPQAQVNFGLANVMGFNNTKVQSRATVEIKSPGIGVMPMYAVQGCDYGPQTLTDPAPGQSGTVAVPALTDADGETNGITLNGLTAALSGVTVPTVPVNSSGAASGYTVTLTDSGNNMDTVTKVGFFRTAGASSPTLVALSKNPAPSQISYNGKQSVSVFIPQSVDSVEAVWYVRVMDASGKWSTRSEAQPLRVGNAVLECAGVANDGNFGSLKIPRNDVNASAWLPTNIAAGLQAPLTLLPVSNPSTAPVTCGSNGNVTPPYIGSTSSSLQPGTNCVDTDTGLPANDATQGLITGAGTSPGRLNAKTSPGCGADPSDRNKRYDTNIKISGSTNYTVNDDLLTCFFTNDTTTINQIIQPNYPGPGVLSPKIFDSPRFFYVPVLKQQPASGGSNMYTIVEMRPAFLTDQPVTATKAGMEVGTTTTHNGLTFKPTGGGNGDIQTMKVIFFNYKALPDTVDGSVRTTDYLGFGTKVITLVD